jgi:parallel beta-helix repeat protein
MDKTLSLIGSGLQNTIISGNSIGSVVTVSANWCNISGFNITQSGELNTNAGIRIESDNNRIQDCKFVDNQIGIFILGSNNNLIRNCIIRSNNGDGLFISGFSNGNTITNNTFIFNNGYGINIDFNCNNNKIFLNNFIGNALDIECPSCPQGFDNGEGNNWNSTTEGNYWFGWTEPDADSNGIVDISYSISGDAEAKDYLPLVNATYEIDFLPPDVFPPTLSSKNIDDNATDFPVSDSEIRIIFNEPMNRSSVELSLSISPLANYSVSWSENGTVLSIRFTEDLVYNTSYRLIINSTAEDRHGNNLKTPLIINFTTRQMGKDEKKEKPVIWESMVFLVGIFIFVVLIIVLLFAFVTRSRKMAKEVEKKKLARIEARREHYSGKIAEEYYYPEFRTESDEFIWNLAHETLELKKPSDFGPPKNKILKKLAIRYRNGEISKATFESISAELSAAGSD